MTVLLPVLAIALIGGRLAAQLAGRLGLPGVFGELALGLALGPLLSLWGGDTSTLSALGDLGVLMLMLLAGLETDLSQLRQIGVVATVIATFGALLPFGAGTALAMALGLATRPAMIVGVALSATSVSITAVTLRELGRLNTRAGGAILMAAVIDDVIGLILLAVVTDSSGSGPVNSLIRVGVMIVVTIGLWFICKPLVRAIESRIEGFLALALGAGFLFAWSAQVLGGLAPITGAYIAGLLLARAAPKTPVAHGVETLASGFFATMFFVSLGLNVRLGDVPWLALALFLPLAALTKIAGCGLGAITGRLPFSEALAVGIGMIPRGEVALIVAALAFQAHAITSGWFSMLVLLATLTTVVTPPLLKLAFAASASPSAAMGAQALADTLDGSLALADERLD